MSPYTTQPYRSLAASICLQAIRDLNCTFNPWRQLDALEWMLDPDSTADTYFGACLDVTPRQFLRHGYHGELTRKSNRQEYLEQPHLQDVFVGMTAEDMDKVLELLRAVRQLLETIGDRFTEEIDLMWALTRVRHS